MNMHSKLKDNKNIILFVTKVYVKKKKHILKNLFLMRKILLIK